MTSWLGSLFAGGGGLVKEFKTEKDLDEFINGHKRVVIQFSMPDCKPCKAMMPIMNEMAELHKGHVSFAKVVVSGDRFAEQADKLGITGFPTFAFYFKTQLLSTMSGADTQRFVKTTRNLRDTK